MAYYDALTAVWNNPTQPPPGVTGAPLTSGMTTQQKVSTVNQWKATASPEPMLVPTYRIYNTFVASEWAALTDVQRQNVRDILMLGQVDGSPNTTVRTTLLSTFVAGTQTRNNLQALAAQFDTASVDWCFNNNYPTHGRDGPGALSVTDASSAGLT